MEEDSPHRRTILRSDVVPDLSGGLSTMIDVVARGTPHGDWAKLRAIDTSHDVARLRAWFEETLVDEPPKEPLHGLFFNVCNPVLASGGATTDLSLSGTRRSHAEDADDWLFTQFYWPREYASSPFLDQLFAIAYGGHDHGPRPGVLANDAEYPLGLAYGVLAARAILAGRTSRDVANATPIVSIAAGFGEGDIALVGEVTPTGFRPNKGSPWS